MLCQKVMCPMNKADFVAQISAAVEEFLRAHPRERFYALAFDCNTEYAEFLVGMNTEEAFQKTLMEYHEGGASDHTDASAIEKLRYNPGDWTYTDIAEDFVSYCIDHDEDPADALARCR